MKKFLDILCLLLFFCSNLFAQTGCLLPDNKLRTTSDGNLLLDPNPLYRDSEFQELPQPNCVWVSQSNMGNCSVCPNDNIFVAPLIGTKTCNSGVMTGTLGFYAIECSLDNFELILLIISSFVALYYLKRNFAKLSYT